MKRSYLLLTAAVLAAVLVAPAYAGAFTITGGGGTQTQNPYGLWYAGQEACAQEGCHAKIAAQASPHGDMVTDVKMYPSKLVPAADSGLWPYSSPFGGVVLRPRDVYLKIGDNFGFLEYIGANGNPLAPTPVPADDIFVWSPMEYLFGEHGGAGKWDEPSGPVAYNTYSQSCSGCHNLGVTRPSDAAYTLQNGGIQTTTTPSSVSAFSIQCEVCHGSGKTPDGHKKGVPTVVGGVQVLKAQVCGQCHVTGVANQKNASGKSFGNPNGYTTDATLSVDFTPYTTVESETVFMAYVNNPKWPGVAAGAAKPKFLPNGANFSLRHSYYNEWLVSGHGKSPRSSVLRDTSDPRCLKCHSGTGYLYRVGAKGADGKRLIASQPTTTSAKANDPGISCQVCHTGHVGYKATGGYDSIRQKPDGDEVGCGDCHNWRYELMDQNMQYETINGVEYTRPPKDARPHIPQREIVKGGYGGEDGRAGLWGVAPMGEFMPGAACQSCHMPRTSKEGMPADDDGTDEATRMSHRFRIVFPGDAERWKLRPNGESCTQRCHEGSASKFTRAEFQGWINETTTTVVAASTQTSDALGAVGKTFGFTRYRDFEAAQPITGEAAKLDPARWSMLQHAAQNLNIVLSDGSKGLHNPTYALAGLRKALMWAKSSSAVLEATVGDGPAQGSGVNVTGTLRGFGDVVIPGAEVALQMSVDGGTVWNTVTTVAPNPATGAFTLPTGPIVGTRIYRVAYLPSAGVEYYSSLMPVAVPVTSASYLPVSAPTGWLNAPVVTVTLSATPGSLTFYTLSGASSAGQTLYTGPISVVAQGATSLTFWSANAQGVESPTTAQLRIDTVAPAVSSDAVGEYLNTATVKIWATDGGTGVTKLEYSLDGAAFATAAETWANVTTARLGSHSLAIRATDGLGQVTSRTVTFRVRNQPRLTKSPKGTSYTVARGKSMVLQATLSKSTGAKVARKTVYLQKSSNGRSWTRYATRTTSSKGVVSCTIKPTKRGTVYWRWYSPSNNSYRVVAGVKTRIVTR